MSLAAAAVHQALAVVPSAQAVPMAHRHPALADRKLAHLAPGIPKRLNDAIRKAWVHLVRARLAHQTDASNNQAPEL